MQKKSAALYLYNLFGEHLAICDCRILFIMHYHTAYYRAYKNGLRLQHESLRKHSNGLCCSDL